MQPRKKASSLVLNFPYISLQFNATKAQENVWNNNYLSFEVPNFFKIYHQIFIQMLLISAILPTRQNGVGNRHKVYKTRENIKLLIMFLKQWLRTHFYHSSSQSIQVYICICNHFVNRYRSLHFDMVCFDSSELQSKQFLQPFSCRLLFSKDRKSKRFTINLTN